MLWNRPTLMLRLLALLVLSEAAHMGFFVTALPLLSQHVGLNAALIGLVMGSHYLADALSKGPMGYVAGRWGAGAVLTAASLLGLVLLGLVAGPLVYEPLGSGPLGSGPLGSGTLGLQRPALWTVLALSVGWGVLYSALWPAVMGYSQELARPGRTARALALTSLCAAGGLVLGIGALGPLMTHDVGLGSRALLGMQLVAAALALSLVRLRPAAASTPSAFPRWAEWREVGLLLPAALAQTLAPALLVSLLFPMLHRFGLTLPDLLAPAALMLGCLGLTLWLAGRLADHSAPRRALLPGLLLLAGAYALLASADPAGRLPAAAALLGTGYGAFLTGWNGMVGQLLPRGQRMAGWGVIMTVEALGYAAGPMLGGLLWTATGHRGVFVAGSVIFVLTLSYYLWPSHTSLGDMRAAVRPAPPSDPVP